MKAIDACDSSHTLEELLSQPSAESWRAIVEVGKRLASRAKTTEEWFSFEDQVKKAVKRWPPEIERLCPASWPADFRAAVEHRVRETDTYGHYLAKICGHPDLRLSDGSQAVWLERRYTGGVVEVSTVKSALRLLSAAKEAINEAFDAPSISASWARVKRALSSINDAVRLLAGGTRNVGKVGCADLTGGVVVEGRYIRFPHTASVKELGSGSWTLQDAGAIKRNEHRLEVEVKVGDEPQRPEQVARMESVRRRGGCYVLANSVESAVAQIKAFISSH